MGVVTRGTTHPNRLRRMDRWIAATHGPELRRSPAPVAVDLGFGAAPWTAVELLGRLRGVAPATRVVGIEIAPERVAAAQPHAREGLLFRRGGFEIPVTEFERAPGAGAVHTEGPGTQARGMRAPGTRPPGTQPGTPRPLGTALGTAASAPGLTLIRAANVLRQYEEAEVAGAWERLCARLAPADPARGSRGGLLVEGTCDEIGRRHVWVALGPEGPRTVTFATRLGSLITPSDLAERLPKALIHRNVPGERVHAFLRDFDRAWAAAAPYAAYGPRQRWIAAVRALTDRWPVLDGPSRWRHGELTLTWSALAPRS
ncbi:class I SAM-dependent methyltransferase [Streptomyces sp. TS71-3]|uniref:class I SAM-dependent methyltransferase n=1 Tax=Streptomyces sp. TS71-3 TaxID=2733862 RepID=UPI001B141E9E|nr:class I SAM-dependent methyltransferase [Streptomyces sp. TS71-3]GHJ34459.1 hypothetical protein Sm713_00680 [Streptomyces sp. TS71-3]